MMTWASYSEALLEPLVFPAALSASEKTQRQADPRWQSWLAHVRYTQLAMQHSFNIDDVWRLDAAILEHQSLFCDAYDTDRFWRPKHHFAQHLSMDIFMWGPPRVRWCFPFEGFNQVVKHIAVGSNFKNVCFRVLHFWSMRSARHFVSGRVASWGVQVVEYYGEPLAVCAATCDDPIVLHLLALLPADSSISVHGISSLEASDGLALSAGGWAFMQVAGGNSRELVHVVRLLEADDGCDALIFAHIMTYLQDSQMESFSQQAQTLALSMTAEQWDVAKANTQENLINVADAQFVSLHHVVSRFGHRWQYL